MNKLEVTISIFSSFSRSNSFHDVCGGGSVCTHMHAQTHMHVIVFTLNFTKHFSFLTFEAFLSQSIRFKGKSLTMKWLWFNVIRKGPEL